MGSSTSVSPFRGWPVVFDRATTRGAASATCCCRQRYSGCCGKVASSSHFSFHVVPAHAAGKCCDAMARKAVGRLRVRSSRAGNRFATVNVPLLPDGCPARPARGKCARSRPSPGVAPIRSIQDEKAKRGANISQSGTCCFTRSRGAALDDLQHMAGITSEGAATLSDWR